MSGRTVAAFKLLPNRRLLGARIPRSSGVGFLDRAYLAAVKSRLYPAFTRRMSGHVTVFRARVGLNDHWNRF